MRMNAETRKALEDSIAHWRENLRCAKVGEEFEYKDDACALCTLYTCGDCRGCPVMERTGFSGCRESPWFEVALAVRDGEPHAVVVKAVKKELDFLISLRPTRKRAKVTPRAPITDDDFHASLAGE